MQKTQFLLGRGELVVWNREGSEIVASGGTFFEVKAKVLAAGEKRPRYERRVALVACPPVFRDRQPREMRIMVGGGRKSAGKLLSGGDLSTAAKAMMTNLLAGQCLVTDWTLVGKPPVPPVKTKSTDHY